MTDKRFIEQFEENVRLYPDKVILRDEHHSLTFQELDELSGRVYAYLKEKGIGREDFVMISLPRGIEVVAAMVGVWKAGAVSVNISEETPLQRRSFIYTDCKCQLDIGADIWTIILAKTSLHGYSIVKSHDAAFAVYTSGSEGRPKGILHEYGKLELFVKSWCISGENVFNKKDIAALPLPLSGVLFVNSILNSLYVGTCYHIIPSRMFAAPLMLIDYLREIKATITCVPPSYLAKYNIQSPYLRLMFLAMEPARDVYSEQYTLLNAYAQSEGVMLCLFKLDKSYDNTPIGKPTDGCSGIYLLDDNDQPVAPGEAGELCYENPYTRGYINLPEETARAFRNGLYHTGDIARIKEDGNYVILGRKSDMIKINGNRIEPAEIEAAVKKILGIDWAFAKGFVEPERSYISVYYTASIYIDYSRTREELLKILPTYMIPSYFVHIDEVPHLPNGKIDRQAFKAPEIEQYRAEYVAPENELEERLCQEMEQILFANKSLAPNEVYGERVPAGWERGFSALDDFYLLGGDSLRTIELVTNLNIENLSVTDIYAARTPRAIAERWMQKMID